MGRISICGLICLTFLCILFISGAQVTCESIPSESDCRPHIEKALNTLKTDNIDNVDNPNAEVVSGSKDTLDQKSNNIDDDDSKENDDDRSNENDGIVADEDNPNSDEKNKDSDEADNDDDDNSAEADNKTEEDDGHDSKEDVKADDDDSKEDDDNKPGENKNNNASDETDNDNKSDEVDSDHKSDENDNKSDENDEADNENDDDSEENTAAATNESTEKSNADNDDNDESTSKEQGDVEKQAKTKEIQENLAATAASDEDNDNDSNENENDSKEHNKDEESDENGNENDSENNESNETESNIKVTAKYNKNKAAQIDDDDEVHNKKINKRETEKKSKDDDKNSEYDDSLPVDDLLLEYEVPKNRRDRTHINELLHLDDESEAKEEVLEKVVESTLKDLKRYYETAIKPLEALYKYRDLSNRHFGDPEIFSKPLVLLMGPWSGGKSTILNYLADNEYTEYSLRTGAEPSPAYFNILMYGDEPQVLDGTQLAADWTFSGLQKFGQGLSDRLRGLKLPSKILKKVNIVEIPGILEVRKQVSRIFPFNDACQWFIDRADIIFLVYDPSKLDVGPETEAILDQLKGREYQTRIILNKADQVHPEELLRVQGALIWNISPLMSSAQPPIMYTVSLWSHPYESGSPVRLLQAQERALFQDLGQAIEHRIENKIASARRFAVRVRNHAKMVDCYLTTYYNHKTLFGNKKKISTEIVEHPQNYHIYEGLSTLTNISRYDLPDPEVYRDFFRLNPLYEFKKLSETCTYFRGCPINRLDVAIAYDLPELVNRYKHTAQAAIVNFETNKNNSTNTNTTTTDRR